MNAVEGWVATLTPVIAISVAIWLAFQNRQLIEQNRKQVQVSQDQFVQSVIAEQDTHLPVLMPVAPLASIGNTTVDALGTANEHAKDGYDREQPFVRIKVENVGPGIALNIWGIVFEPEPAPMYAELRKLTGLHHYHRYAMPLKSGENIRLDWTGGGIPVTGDTEIGTTTKRYMLYAPPRPTPAEAQRGVTEKIARLTLTYSDIFGRKHAAIYDLTAQMQWENVDYLRDIPADLGDLERNALKDVAVWAAPKVPSALSYPHLLEAIS